MFGRVAIVVGVLVGGLGACAPHPRLAPQASTPPPVLPDVFFKRVEDWRFVALDLPPTAVERQLRRQFERVFAHAQFSKEYTCLAREDGNFYEKYGARPEEWLEQQMMGRCGAPTAGQWNTRTYYSDGTMLDSPLSDANLNDISARFAAILPPFKVFGITAQASGPNVVVTVETASPEATIHIGDADADRNVHVDGEIFGAYKKARAIINQGDAGTAVCEKDDDVQWPKYAFTCSMAPGDTEAWVSVSAIGGPKSWEYPLGELPAHQAGWVVPAEYHRALRALPLQVDTAHALVATINELRRGLGQRALHLASEQSNFIQPVYEQAFELNASGEWLGDHQHRVQMLRGDRVQGAVAWAAIASGIAFDGDAADWLAYRLLNPISRRTLMDAEVDEIAIATHGDPVVGFGAAAVVYALLTPQREAALADELEQSITKARKRRPSQRLKNPPELEAAARDVATGQSLRALSAALTRVNLSRSGPGYMAGLVVPLDDDGPAASPVAPLLAANALSYGIVITHVTNPKTGWVSAVAFVWFLTDRPVEREAALGTAQVRPIDRSRPHAPPGTKTPLNIVLSALAHPGRRI
jgi:hypothetical protein